MSAQSTRVSPGRVISIATIVLATVGLDQISKHLARVFLRDAGTVRVIGSLLVLRYAENQGAFLSLGAGWHPMLRAAVFVALSLAIVAAAAVYLFRDRSLAPLQSAALALVVGGGAGNLIDRLARGGSVTDFLNLGIGRLRTGIFNLADLFLLAGVILFVLARGRPRGRVPGRRNPYDPPMKIEPDHVIWITGASSGIGRALALELAPRARLILSGRDANRLEEVRRLCADRAPAPESIRLLPFDLADPAAVQGAPPAASALFGRIDLLALCGGVSQRALFEETSPDTMDRLLEVNYRSAVILIRGCLPVMRQQGSGRIVAVTSLAGKVGAPLRSGYCAAKHALQGFCNALRAELLSRGIGVTVVVPGFVRTGISHHALTGGGAPHGRMDALQAAGISPEICARDIVRGIQRGKAEIKTGFDLKSWLALAVSHTAIGLYTRLIARSRVS